MPALAYVGSAYAPAVIDYALFNGGTSGSTYHIGAATRTDGMWTEYAGNPILSAGSGWESQHVKDPCLVWDGGRYVCYYSGNDGSTYEIGRATASAHTGPWTKYAGNPVLTVGAGGSFDDSGVAFPTVLYEPTDTGKEWKMWYRADDGANLTVGYAYSSDGLSWTKVGMVIDKGAGGTWDDEGVLPGAIYKDSGTYYLFVGGRQNLTTNKWQGGLWTFSDPEGTYTPDAGNPIILARFNDANSSQTPTANVSAAATTVSLTTPGAFNVGEPFALVDGSDLVEPMIGYITAVGGGSVTFDRASPSLYHSSGGVFRSFAYTSNIPRSVLARTGGYEAFVSLFQPVEDLTVSSGHLYEGSFEMRASALTGTWSYYYVAGRGLLFPLQIGASWHTRSAENPSVIPAP